MAITTTPMIVPRIPKTVNGLLYWVPSHRATPTPITSWTNTETYGERYRGLTRCRMAGNRRIRPIAYSVRVAALEPAFALAMAELAMARNNSTHPAPHTIRATASQGVPPPVVGNSAYLAGPKNTVEAYVVRM